MSGQDPSNILNRLELSQNLRGSLQRAAGYVYEQSHRQVTLEHLLLALTEDPDAAVILEASQVNVSGMVTEVSDYLGRLEDRVEGDGARQPALGRDVIRIFQSAAAAAQKSQRRAIGSALLLAAIVGEGRSPAAQILRNQGLTFEQAIEALRQANAAQAARPVDSASAASPQPAAQAPAQSAPGVASAAAEPAQPAAAEPVDGQQLQPTASEAEGEHPRAEAPAAPPGGPRVPPSSRQVQAARDVLAGARERVAAASGKAPTEPQPDRTPPSSETARVPRKQPPPEPASPPPQDAPLAGARKPHAKEAVGPPPPPSRPVTPDQQQAAVLAPSEPPHVQATRPEPAPPQGRTPAPPPPIGPGQPSLSSPPAESAPRPPLAADSQQPQPVPPRPDPPRRPGRAGPHREGGPGPHLLPPGYPERTMPPAQATNGRGPPAHPDELRPAQRPPASTRPPQPDWTQHERGPASGPPHVGRQPAALPSASPPRTEPAPRADSALAPKAVDNAAFDAKSLLAEVPKRMRAGKPVTVAVRVPRHQLEAWSSGGADAAAASRQVITKAMMMRLKAAPSDFAVENASPETQWSEGYQGPLSDDIVSWRWIVKPRRSGRHSLHLNGATRIVGRDGLAAERPLPPQRVTVRVSPDYIGVARRATVLLLIAATAGALGYFADGLYDLGRSALAQLVR